MRALDPKSRVSGHYPPDIVEKLQHAAKSTRWDNSAAIDLVTDELVRRGLARNRKDASRASEWARMRDGTPGKSPRVGGR